MSNNTIFMSLFRALRSRGDMIMLYVALPGSLACRIPTMLLNSDILLGAGSNVGPRAKINREGGGREQ